MYVCLHIYTLYICKGFNIKSISHFLILIILISILIILILEWWITCPPTPQISCWPPTFHSHSLTEFTFNHLTALGSRRDCFSLASGVMLYCSVNSLLRLVRWGGRGRDCGAPGVLNAYGGVTIKTKESSSCHWTESSWECGAGQHVDEDKCRQGKAKQ